LRSARVRSYEHRNNADVVRNPTRRNVMYAVSKASLSTQRAVCMLMSVAIVTVSLAFGAFGVKSMEHLGYSVTVTQLQ
jgi:hypothetical protein